VGLTVLDAGVLIAVLDGNDLHHDAARHALSAALDGNDQLAVPASALAETLVGAARRGDDAIAVVNEFVRRLPATVVPVDEPMAVAAARLRARHGGRLKLPDALVVATAQVLDAERLLTTDRGWPARRSLGLRAQVVRV
jgi:predicted nucleic acid-binding protein